MELDPFSVLYNAWLSCIYYFFRQLDKAIAHSYKTLELAPNDPTVHLFLCRTLAAKGMFDEAITKLQQFEDIPLLTAHLGYIYGKAGKRNEAQRILNEFLERSKQAYFSPRLIADVYAGLGDKDKTFEWLEKAFEERDPNNFVIKVEPIYGGEMDIDKYYNWAIHSSMAFVVYHDTAIQHSGDLTIT